MPTFVVEPTAIGVVGYLHHADCRGTIRRVEVLPIATDPHWERQGVGAALVEWGRAEYPGDLIEAETDGDASASLDRSGSILNRSVSCLPVSRDFGSYCGPIQFGNQRILWMRTLRSGSVEAFVTTSRSQSDHPEGHDSGE